MRPDLGGGRNIVLFGAGQQVEDAGRPARVAEGLVLRGQGLTQSPQQRGAAFDADQRIGRPDLEGLRQMFGDQASSWIWTSKM